MLHIDPTKTLTPRTAPSLGTVIERVIELTSAVEGHASSTGIKNSGFINYEIGTEETAGGIIDPQPFAHFFGPNNKLVQKKRFRETRLYRGSNRYTGKNEHKCGKF